MTEGGRPREWEVQVTVQPAVTWGVGEPLSTACSLQGEPPSALGLSTRKALSILKEQLEAVLDGHLRERNKCQTWKVKHVFCEMFPVGK